MQHFEYLKTSIEQMKEKRQAHSGNSDLYQWYDGQVVAFHSMLAHMMLAERLEEIMPLAVEAANKSSDMAFKAKLDASGI